MNQTLYYLKSLILIVKPAKRQRFTVQKFTISDVKIQRSVAVIDCKTILFGSNPGLGSITIVQRIMRVLAYSKRIILYCLIKIFLFIIFISYLFQFLSNFFHTSLTAFINILIKWFLSFNRLITISTIVWFWLLYPDLSNLNISKSIN